MSLLGFWLAPKHRPRTPLAAVFFWVVVAVGYVGIIKAVREVVFKPRW